MSDRVTSTTLVTMDTRKRLLPLWRLGDRWNVAPHWSDGGDTYRQPDSRRTQVGGYPVPRHFTGGFRIEGLAAVEVTVRIEAASPVVERVEIVGPITRVGPTGTRQFGAVTPEAIRQVASALPHELPRIIALWAPYVQAREMEKGQLERAPDAVRAIRVDAAARGARRKLNHELLTRVADVYRRAEYLPRQAVVEAFDIPENTANRWIKKARDANLLGPAPKPGVAGETE